MGVKIAFKGRRGATKDNNAVLDLRPNDCYIAGMIAWGFLLFVGGFVLFVHDDETEVFERCKDGAAGANDDPSAAGMEFVPFVVALAFGKVTVEDGNDCGSESVDETPGLRSAKRLLKR